MQGAVAIVTGGASGIGFAVAEQLVALGAIVVIADLDAEQGVAAAAALGASFIQTDVAASTSVAALYDGVHARHGKLDLSVHCAGIEGEESATVFVSEETWDAVMAVNVKGTWLCMKHAVRRMLPASRGSIVNVASVAGLVGAKLVSPYVASKHAVVGLTKSAALEYAASGIRINAVCPSYIEGPMMNRLVGGDTKRLDQLAGRIPMGRLGTAAEIAASIVWLCNDASSFVTGTALVVDGGFLAQ